MVVLKTNVVQQDHIDMYSIKLLNFVSIYLAVMIDQSTCDEFADYLFAGTDKMSILTDYPATVAQEANQFEAKKPGFFTKIKDVISGWMSSTIPETIAPEITFTEGTYSCAGSSCTRVPGDENVDYERIKMDSAAVTEAAENDLTKDGRSGVRFIDPPEILKNIDPKGMIDVLDKGYEEKKRKKQQ